MDYQQLALYLIVLLVLFGIFSTHQLRTKIHCTFRRRDKTKAVRWAKATNGGRIEFEGGWYYILTKCTTLIPWDKGIHILFPTMVRSLDFRYDSPMPLDPETFNNNFETPEARVNLNKQEDIASANIGAKKALGMVKAQGLLGSGWMPIIMVLAVVVVGYMTYQLNNRVDMLGNAINVLQQMMVR